MRLDWRNSIHFLQSLLTPFGQVHASRLNGDMAVSRTLIHCSAIRTFCITDCLTLNPGRSGMERLKSGKYLLLLITVPVCTIIFKKTKIKSVVEVAEA